MHNRFRSKVAEAIFNKLNKNKKISADSGGLLIDEIRPYVAQEVIKIMKEKGYVIGGIPKKVNVANINDYSTLIIVANNVEPEFFISSGYKGKIIWWKIKDVSELDSDGVTEKINEIEKRVKGLFRELS